MIPAARKPLWAKGFQFAKFSLDFGLCRMQYGSSISEEPNMGYQLNENGKQRRGFAGMDPEKRRLIATKGGASTPGAKRSFSQNRELARAAGAKGGGAARRCSPYTATREIAKLLPATLAELIAATGKPRNTILGRLHGMKVRGLMERSDNTPSVGPNSRPVYALTAAGARELLPNLAQAA